MFLSFFKHVFSCPSFSETCFLDEDGLPTCDACLEGYRGRRCERYISFPSRDRPTSLYRYFAICNNLDCIVCAKSGVSYITKIMNTAAFLSFNPGVR